MRIKLLTVAVLAACTLPTTWAAPNVYVFGDSLSDIGQAGWEDRPDAKGNYHQAATYYNADGTRNLLYNEIVAQKLGSMMAASSKGGSNYAHSGGVINADNLFLNRTWRDDHPEKSTQLFVTPAKEYGDTAHNNFVQDQPNLGISQQIENFIQDNKNRHRPINNNDLFILWGGGNDMAAIMSKAASLQVSEGLQAAQQQVFKSVGETANRLGQQAAILKQNGAAMIIAPDIPNIAYTPVIEDRIVQAFASQIYQGSREAGLPVKTVATQDFNNTVPQEVGSQPVSTAVHKIIYDIWTQFGIPPQTVNYTASGTVSIPIDTQLGRCEQAEGCTPMGTGSENTYNTIYSTEGTISNVALSTDSGPLNVIEKYQSRLNFFNQPLDPDNPPGGWQDGTLTLPWPIGNYRDLTPFFNHEFNPQMKVTDATLRADITFEKSNAQSLIADAYYKSLLFAYRQILQQETVSSTQRNLHDLTSQREKILARLVQYIWDKKPNEILDPITGAVLHSTTKATVTMTVENQDNLNQCLKKFKQNNTVADDETCRGEYARTLSDYERNAIFKEMGEDTRERLLGQLNQTIEKEIIEDSSKNIDQEVNDGLLTYGEALQQKFPGATPESFSEYLIDLYHQFSSSAADATALYNLQTTAALNKAHGNVLRLSVNELFNEMLNNPQAFGFKNTISTACSSFSPYSKCIARSSSTPNDASKEDLKQEYNKWRVSDGYVDPIVQADGSITPGKDGSEEPYQAQQFTHNHPDDYLFVDGFHPGPKAHKIMADYLVSTLTAPSEMVTLPETALNVAANNTEFARNQSNQYRHQPETTSDINMIAAIEQTNDDYTIGHVGVDVPITPNLHTNVILSHTYQKDITNGQTTITHNQNTLSASIRYDAKNVWLGAIGSIDQAQDSTLRTIHLGDVYVKHQQGNTSGYGFGLGAFAGLEFGQQFKFSLQGDITGWIGNTHGFSEQSGGATQLSYLKQPYRNIRSGLGVALRYADSAFQPYIKIKWIKDWYKPKFMTVGASMNGSTYHYQTAALYQPISVINTQIGTSWHSVSTPLYVYVSVDKSWPQVKGFDFQSGLGWRF